MKDDLIKSSPAAFGQYPEEYERWASPQKKCAERLVGLAAHILKDTNENGPFSILDVGGGTGFIHDAVIQNDFFSNAGFINVDASESALRFCLMKKNVQCVLADAHKIPFLNNAFNLIFSSFCFHWFENAAVHIKQIFKSLTPGGSFYQAVPVEGSLNEFYGFIQKAGAESTFELNPLKYPHEVNVTDTLKKGGFVIEHSISDAFSFKPSSIVDALRFMRYAGGAAVTRDKNKGSLFHLAARLAHFKYVPPINFRVLITLARKT